MAFEFKLRISFFSTLYLVLIVMNSFCSPAFGISCREKIVERSCESLCSKNGTCVLRAAVVLPKNTTTNASWPTVAPVLELATQEIVRLNLLPNITIVWKPHDDQCDASFALISAIDAYADECVHVFFGPVCEYALASIARITKFLGKTGTPLLTVGGLSFDFVNKKTECADEYHMLTRAGLVNFRDIAYFIIELMYRYRWRRILFINEPQGQYSVGGKATCHLMMKTMAEYMKKDSNLMYSSWDTTQNRGQNYSDNLRLEMAMSFTNITGVAYCWFSSGTPDTKSPA